MAGPAVKETTKIKHTVKEDQPKGGSHGHHGGQHEEEEGKTQAPQSPVLIEKPGATSSTKLDGKGLKVTIVASRWYGKETHSLVEACSEELLDKGVAEDDLHLIEVTGAFELPYAAARIIHCKDASHRPDAVVCIGCIVKDGTHMCETMSHAVANGIMKLNVTSDVPVTFGVLCCESEAQAHACATECVSGGGGSGEKCNHGVSWAQSALEMAHLKHCAAAMKAEKCQCTLCTSRGVSGGKSETGKHESFDSCKRCGSPAEKCSCLDCNCKSCCSKRGECSSCGSSSNKCSCKDCKCKVCCENREACRSCGCPADKCSCEDCKCSSCSSKKSPAMETPQAETASKHEGSSSTTGGESGECATCGSPGGKCKCGLLH